MLLLSELVSVGCLLMLIGWLVVRFVCIVVLCVIEMLIILIGGWIVFVVNVMLLNRLLFDSGMMSVVVLGSVFRILMLIVVWLVMMCGLLNGGMYV